MKLSFNFCFISFLYKTSFVSELPIFFQLILYIEKGLVFVSYYTILPFSFFGIYGSSKISLCYCKEVTDAKREALEPTFDVHEMVEKLLLIGGVDFEYQF